MFETLWFRLVGLALGNGVWASSLVLAGFMAGLALGNGLSARLAPRWRSPLHVYAFLEAAVGLLGLAVVGALAERDWERSAALMAEADRRGAPVADLARARAFVAEMAQRERP